MTPKPTTVRRFAGAASGLLSGALALCVAELSTTAVRPEAAPVIAVGEAVIDRTPAPVKDWAISTFGTNDKLVLKLTVFGLLTLFAMGLGLLAVRFTRLGASGVLLLGAFGAVAAASRPDHRPWDALPSLVGAAAGAVALLVLGRTLQAQADRFSPQHHPAPARASGGAGVAAGPNAAPSPRVRDGIDRRGFVIAASATATLSGAAGFAGARLSDAAAADAAAARSAVRFPWPASAAGPLPQGARLRVPGLTPFTTSNRDFYRIDTALTVPRVDADRWKLRIHGAGVSRPMTLDFRQLLDRELVERDITLTCVSNEVGGKLAGNARWLGVPLAPLLHEAGVRPPSRGGPADQLLARSVDGMTIGTPVETVMDGRDALLAVGMNGEPLPFAHGYPVRMVVPGLYGYVSACKWIKDIELTTFDTYDAYWVKRGWARTAPIKTQSRIDTPKPLADLRAGPVPVAGVAWAQHRGIARVEVRVDGGPWHTARLAAEASVDTWRQWSWVWEATPGRHTLQVRATDGDRRRQTSRRVRTVPDGASGWHSAVVTVT